MNLLDILYNFNPDFNWGKTQDDIQKAVPDYNEAIAEGSENPGEFLYGCLPVYWQIVRQHNIHQWGGTNRLPSNSQYNIGIFLVGFSSLPIALSIAEIQPRQRIYFLHSEDTEPKCDEITDRIEEMLVIPPAPFDPLITCTDAIALIDRVQRADRYEIANPSDPVETFKKVKEIIDSLGRNTNIALDLTGGKKTMIGGGFTAGSIYTHSPKCYMFYVDSSEYDPDRGAPIPSTEFLSQLDNPYHVYNVQSVTEAEKLFNNYNYEAAAGLWDKISANLKRQVHRYGKSQAKLYGWEREQETVQKNLDMANCYRFWDAFDYEKATKLRKCHKNSWGYNEKHAHGKLPNAINVLGILSQVKDRCTLFEKEPRVIHYAVDRYQNGMRRKRSGKLEDAIIRFTQVIEILCNYRVYQIAGVDKLHKSNNNPLVADAERTWKLTPLIYFLFGCQRYDVGWGKYYQIVDSSEFLSIEDYHGPVETVCDIEKLINHRNDFVHVNSPMRQEVIREIAERLRELALKFLRKFSNNYCNFPGLSFNELLKLHEFRRLT